MAYTTTTNKLKITELDFDAIKTALKTYLSGQDEFKDYDFEGSAMSILIDILAYNTHYNGFYANMLASEMFLDSAALRSSVVSLAKHLGYTPASKKGSSIKLDLSFAGEPGLANILIPKNSKFTSKIGGETYTFLTTEARTASLNEEGTAYVAKEIQIKEGVFFTSTQTATGANNQIFSIPNEDMDISTLYVTVAGEVYNKVDDYTEITSTSKVYFIQEGEGLQYDIYFGDGTIGTRPTSGDIVQIEYNVSILGSDGNGARTFTLAESLIGLSSATVSLTKTYIRSSGGAERETVSSIRLQAPRQYALQKRVVTAQDYKTRLKNDYNIVDSVRVWGGEENVPPQFGKVFISIKPKTGYVLSKQEKKWVAKDILKKRNMVTIKPEFVDPDYLFVVADITAAYDPRKTTRTADELMTMIKTATLNYSAENLGKFDDYFRFSRLVREIDDTDESILNNTTSVAIKKRIKPVLRVSGAYRIFFDNPLHRPHPGHRNILTSTTFTYNGIKKCSLVDKDGVIKIVQADLKVPATKAIGDLNKKYSDLKYGNWGYDPYSDNFATSTKLPEYLNLERHIDGREIVADIGRINYSTGEVFIEKFKPTTITDNSDYIYIAVKPHIFDILPVGNTILTIESDDIGVSVIDDTDRLSELKIQSY